MARRIDDNFDAYGRLFSAVSDVRDYPQSHPAVRSLPPKLDDGDSATIEYAGITIAVGAGEARRGDRLLQLTVTEFRMLKLLLEQPERAFTRVELKEAVWGRGVKLELSSINSYLGRLRRALNADGEPNVIRTITGYGYSIDATFPGRR